MKPYNERLPMIDAAIDYYKGKLPREANPDSTLIVGAYGSYYFISEEYFNTYSGESEFVCYEEEFEQRAKELGCINGYKWGVVYKNENHGKDLPDDLEISITLPNWFGSGSVWLTGCNPTNLQDSPAYYFKITDERY